jgi:hypothetical protein
LAKAVKEAIRAGGIKALSYDDQFLVVRALQILKIIPDKFEEKPKEK